MMDDDRLLTISDFAYKIGKSERQVRRYLQQGRLQSVDTPLGQRIPGLELTTWERLSATVDRSGLADKAGHWMEDAGHRPDLFRRGAGQWPGGSGQVPDNDGHAQAASTLEAGHRPDNDGQTTANFVLVEHTTDESGPELLQDPTLTKALEIASMAMRRSEQLELALEVERERRIAEQLARERGERRADALAVELNGYRRALGEQAESLAEERALVLQERAQRMKLEEERKASEQEIVELRASAELTAQTSPAQRSSGWRTLRRWLNMKIG